MEFATFVSRDFKRADTSLKIFEVMNSKRESYIQNSCFNPQNAEFTMLASEELGT